MERSGRDSPRGCCESDLGEPLTVCGHTERFDHALRCIRRAVQDTGWITALPGCFARVGGDTGFQWLDGSFLEHIEVLDVRPPNDIDVVTFFHLPTGQTQASLASGAPTVFDSQISKQNFFVDAYLVCLGGRAEKLVAHSAYWYSVWSHRRNQMWKGYVQIDLSPSEDATATSLLGTLQTAGNRSTVILPQPVDLQRNIWAPYKPQEDSHEP